MSTATVTCSGTNGFWFAEDNDTRESVFIHISQIERHKYLHIGDEVEYTLGMNPKSGKEWATAVKLTYVVPKPERGARS
ncbi:MAG TPA: cold shock domain-containing protein [Candidatus Acidoferrales bacterium]|jgi:cold shock CspA family protein|nr:cold shock domain-containing protein [Candidatus Acidoferrales bacterium]